MDPNSLGEPPQEPPVPEPVVKVQSKGEVLLITIAVPTLFDEMLTRTVGQRMFDAVKDVANPRVVLDLAGVNEMGSRFFGTLIHFRKDVTTRGGNIALAAMKPAVLQSFRIAALNRTFPTFDKVDAAIQSLVDAERSAQ